MSNLRARELLERAQRLFRERPSAAKKNVPATAVMGYCLADKPTCQLLTLR